MTSLIETSLGNFQLINPNEAKTGDFIDAYIFQCPGCGQWAYLDYDQWHGLVSVDHATDGCPGAYHQTHDFYTALKGALAALDDS
jgi:hypothetical protein